MGAVLLALAYGEAVDGTAVAAAVGIVEAAGVYTNDALAAGNKILKQLAVAADMLGRAAAHF